MCGDGICLPAFAWNESVDADLCHLACAYTNEANMRRYCMYEITSV